MPKFTLIDVYTLVASVFNTSTLNVGTSIFAKIYVSIAITGLHLQKSCNVLISRLSGLCSDSCPTYYSTLREIPETSQLFLEKRRNKKKAQK